jgi:hypothetical protein
MLHRDDHRSVTQCNQVTKPYLAVTMASRVLLLALTCVAVVAAVDVGSARHLERAACCELPQCPGPCSGVYIAQTTTRVVQSLPRTIIDDNVVAAPRPGKRGGRNSTNTTRKAKAKRSRRANNATSGIVTPTIVKSLGGLRNVPVLEYDACQRAWVLRCRAISIVSQQTACMQQLPLCSSLGAKKNNTNSTPAVRRARVRAGA